MAQLLKSGALSEDSIHKTVMQWVKSHPYLSKLTLHFPNEGQRHARFGKSLKDKGMRAGVSDLLIAMPNHGFGGGWVELKSESGSLSKEQKEFLIDMEQQNYFTAVTWSLDEALAILMWYCHGSVWKQGDLWPLPNRYRTPFQRSLEAPHGKHL